MNLEHPPLEIPPRAREGGCQIEARSEFILINAIQLKYLFEQNRVVTKQATFNRASDIGLTVLRRLKDE